MLGKYIVDYNGIKDCWNQDYWCQVTRMSEVTNNWDYEGFAVIGNDLYELI